MIDPSDVSTSTKHEMQPFMPQNLTTLLRLLLIFCLSITLISCATDYEVTHAYQGPSKQESELALVAGLQRKGAGIEFYSVDGKELSPSLSGRPVAIYLTPGQHHLTVEWSNQQLLDKRRVSYQVLYRSFNAIFLAGNRYVVRFLAPDASTETKFSIWLENVDTSEIFSPEAPYEKARSSVNQ